MVIMKCNGNETDSRGNHIEPGYRIPIDDRKPHKEIDIDIEMFAKPIGFEKKVDGRGMKRGPGKGRPRNHGLVGSTKYDNGIDVIGSESELPGGLPLSDKILEFMQAIGK